MALGDHFDDAIDHFDGGLIVNNIRRHIHLPGPSRSALPRAGVRANEGPYLPYLRKRWEEGCHNGLQLARELNCTG